MRGKLTSLKFRGKRDYLLAADLYEALGALVARTFPGGKISEIDLSVLTKTRFQLEYAFGKFTPGALSPVARASFLVDGRAEIVHFFEMEDPIRDRADFEEAHIASQSSMVGPGELKFLGTTHLRDMEFLVSLTKLLHQKLYPQEGRSWIVTRIMTATFLEKTFANEFSVKFGSFLNADITRSICSADGVPTAELIFYKSVTA